MIQIPDTAPLSAAQRERLTNVLGELTSEQTSWLLNYLATTPEKTPATTAADVVAYNLKNPFPARLNHRRLLNAPGSTKETWHLEFDISGSGMSYEPGDSLALIPTNAPDVVASVLEACGLEGNTPIDLKDVGTIDLDEAFTKYLDITSLNSMVIKKYNLLAKSEKLASLLEPENSTNLGNYLRGRQFIDLLEDFRIPGITTADLTQVLRKLPPRLYSIASSLKAHPGEVHLTVAAVRYETHGKKRKGVASTFLADVLTENGTSKVYTHANKNFRLPIDGNTPIIMVGPGTGIAPFRGFIEERRANGDHGKSWLFFGDQHRAVDYIYESEWMDHLQSGALTRLDTAFSRDQENKIYVQHRMLEHAAELWAWLQEGAYFYVCGDASKMAADVNTALIQVAILGGGLDQDAATQFVEKLKNNKRYQRDVY